MVLGGLGLGLGLGEEKSTEVVPYEGLRAVLGMVEGLRV
jgi:hypothetical protein